MSGILLLVLALGLGLSLVLGLFTFWIAARIFAGPTGTFFNALKCQVCLLALGIGELLFCVVALLLARGTLISVLLLIGSAIVALVLVFRIPMRIYDIGFFRVLGIHFLNGIFGLICNRAITAVAILFLPSLGPMMQRERPAVAERLRSFIDAQAGSPAAVPKETAGRESPLDLAKKDVASAQAGLDQIETTANQEYAGLSEKRKTLDEKNAGAVHEFNVQAAEYATTRGNLDAQRKELARLKKQVALIEAQAADAAQRDKDGVVIYFTSWCPACTAAKQYFAQRNISYREIDVERSPEGAAEFHRLGGTGVPLIVIRGEKMTGFSQAWVEARLKN